MSEHNAGGHQSPVHTRDFETHNAHCRDLVQRLLRVKAFVFSIALHGLPGRIPDVPICGDGAWLVRLVVVHKGTSRCHHEATVGLRGDDPATAFDVLEEVPDSYSPVLTLGHLVDGHAIRARQLEVEPVHNGILPSSSLDEHVLFGKAQVGVFSDQPDHNQLLFLLAPCKAGTAVGLGMSCPRGCGDLLDCHSFITVYTLRVILSAKAKEARLLLG
mmetsp:Transcript_47013/g.108657  ORF Transcript_47013/g.108657 Transcript_47013/m.108657 type:complete len:216 (-) Transcript_47013:2585-3232(-)